MSAARSSGSPALRLFGRMRPWAGLVLAGALLGAVYHGGRYLRAWLVKPLVDDVLVPHGAAAAGAAELLASFAGIVSVVAALTLGLPLLLFARDYLVEHALGRVRVDIERSLCGRLLALPLRFHHERARGDLLARTLSDVGSAHGALRLVFGDFVQSLVSVVVGVGFLFAISWQLAVATLLTAPPVVLVISRFGQRIRRAARRRQEKLADVTQRLVEILAGIEVIKAFRAEALEEAAFRRETEQLFRRSMRVAANRIGARSGIELVTFAAGLGVFGVGFWLVLGGRFGLSSGDLMAYAALLATIYQPTKMLARGWARLFEALPAAERFFEVLDAPTEPADAPDAVRIDGVRRGISLRDVCFGYGAEEVLERVSFEVRAGETVALVGRTGAGKSTLVDLLLRFYDPDDGHIEIDGIDLRRIERASLRRQIAVVGQEAFLFDATIRENIAYGRPEAGDAEIREAARAARVDEFAERLDAGYETRVGPLGVRLSGGERQRVAIARAILRDPAILVLDEATSALDALSERAVQQGLAVLLGGERTVFLVAHRLSAFRRADRIVVLDKGRAVQTGTHDDLVREEGLYRELVLPQQHAAFRL